MNKPSFGDRLRYIFDNTLSKGPVSLIGWLLGISVVLILISSALIWILDITPNPNFAKLLWTNMMQTLDPGAIDAEAGSWSFLLIMLGVTFGGIFVTSTLIGILTTGIEERIEKLRKGRSRIIETNHTLILGWTEQIYAIITELTIANENQRRSCIVVMADKDKVEMEDEIREMVGSTGRTRVVCRTGDPIDVNDLEIASPQTARSIIILSPESKDPDSSVIKTMLALTNNPNRRPDLYHIVAEIRDPKNVEAARIVGSNEVELVMVGDVISRVIAQTCRQSGLSVVYTELLDFSGDEIYFHHEPALTGQSFGQTLLAYKESAVIGLYRDQAPKLNPPMNTTLQADDKLIIISADDDTIHLSDLESLDVQEKAIQTGKPTKAAPECTLILGWNWRAPLIINELDHYVSPGSELTIVSNVPESESEIALHCAELENLGITIQFGDTTDRRMLDKLSIKNYHHIIILCYSDTLTPQQADACTLITLLHLRDISEHTGQPFSIVSEMLDIRNRNLAEVTRADDFIVSDRLISLMLSQVSENKHLNAVFTDLFDRDGSEIYLKPAGDYVELGRPLNFYTVVESARQRGEVAMGYRLQSQANHADMAYGVVINPEKSKPITFGRGDKVIVLAEE